MGPSWLRGSVDVRNLAAVAGTVVGIVGLWLTYEQVVAGQPDLVVRSERIVLRSEFNPLALHRRLGDLSFRLRGNGLDAYRGLYRIAQETAAELAEERGAEYKNHLRRLPRQLERLRKAIAEEPGEWRVEQVAYDNGAVRWADGLELELSGARLAFRGRLSRETIERVTDNWSNLDEETTARVRRAAVTLRNAAANNVVGRNSIVAQLAELEGTLDGAVENRDERVFVTLGVLNRSRTPNAIMRDGLLRVGGEDIRIRLAGWGERDREVLVGDYGGDYGGDYDGVYRFPMNGLQPGVGNWINENGGIAPYGGLTLLFRSRRLENLDEEVRRAIRVAFAENAAFALVVQDANEETWTARGELGRSRGEEYDRVLVSALNSVMPSGGER